MERPSLCGYDVRSLDPHPTRDEYPARIVFFGRYQALDVAGGAMATWDETKLKDEACPVCGTVYHVTHKSLPLKDKATFTCKCGHVLREWKETGMYIYTKAD